MAASDDEIRSEIIIGCMLAASITGIASAIGLALTGVSAVGVVAEKPELFGKTLILQLLPMTQSIYGLLTAILLMMGGGLLGGGGALTPLMGRGAIFIGMVVGFTGLSAIMQGMIASSAIAGTARNPGITARGIMYAATAETMAIFGLLVAILLMTGIGFL
ncbi:MAG: V-type ATP synthase subunit K [Thermoplasmatales archaeon]|nr:V-type ATP synthase subunit K [Thermoplasmatales archaeon]